MKPRLLHIPFFPFLLPVFFVLHGFVENFLYVRLVDCLTLTGIYLVAALLVLGFFRIFLKNNTKAALMAGFVLSFYFFFGVFHALLHDHRVLVTVEDGTVTNGFGAFLAGLVQTVAPETRVVPLGAPDRTYEHAPRAQQLAEVGLTADGIAARVRALASEESLTAP